MQIGKQRISNRIEAFTDALSLIEERPSDARLLIEGAILGLTDALRMFSDEDPAKPASRIESVIAPVIEIPVEPRDIEDEPAASVESEIVETEGEDDTDTDNEPKREDAEEPIQPELPKKSAIDRVLDAWNAGHRKARGISEATGIKAASVHTYLSTLRKEGKIPRPEPEATMEPDADRSTSPRVRVLEAWNSGLRSPAVISQRLSLKLATVLFIIAQLRTDKLIEEEPTTLPGK